MPRAVAFSHKQKKEQLKAKRAFKRGDEDASVLEGFSKTAFKARALGSRHRVGFAKSGPGTGTTQRLESKFGTIPAEFLERTRDLAFEEALPRPLPPSSAAFPLELLTRDTNPDGSDALSIPRRPKFKYDQTKKEVERNEEGMFRKWLASTRETIEGWVDAQDGSDGSWPRSPSAFETNLEVWRQLWRVVEASAIVCLLVDARCPPLHCPPSLRTYLRSFRPKRQFVLVLTKADLVDPAALEGWRTWLKEWWNSSAGDNDAEEDDTQVVAVTSYDLELLYGEGRRRHRPALPSSSRDALVDALRKAHERLLRPPASIQAKPEKRAAWRPAVRSNVDWDALAAEPEPVGRQRTRRERPAAGAHHSGSEEEEEEEDAESDDGDEDAANGPARHQRDPETEPLTIGLVGQPNVGKSSLLNALLGTTRVSASRTPGKTKNFQTILWGDAREVKFVDCSGLVCPSPVPMELQAMSGILPIAHIPSLPACTAFVARHIPLEDVFRIPEPEREVNDMEMKKTWRHPRPAEDVPAEPAARKWTAGEIMECRALDRGYFNSKGGRPDANRAGNEMLRAVAEGRVRWGFWPPNAPEAQLDARRGVGVWLGGNPDLEKHGHTDEGTDSGAEDVAHTAESNSDAEEEEEEEEEEESDDDDDGFASRNHRSFFAALSINDNEDDSDEEEEEETEAA